MKGLFLGSILAIAMAACLDTASDPPPSTSAREAELADDLGGATTSSIPGFMWYCTNAPVCVVDESPQMCRAVCSAVGVAAPRCRYLEEWPTCD